MEVSEPFPDCPGSVAGRWKAQSSAGIGVGGTVADLLGSGKLYRGGTNSTTAGDPLQVYYLAVESIIPWPSVAVQLGGGGLDFQPRRYNEPVSGKRAALRTDL